MVTVAMAEPQKARSRRVVTPSARAISKGVSMPEAVWDSIVFKVEGKAIEPNTRQPSKACAPTVVTPSGIATSKSSEWAKARSPIVFKPRGNCKVYASLPIASSQPKVSNAPGAMCSMDEGRTLACKGQGAAISVLPSLLHKKPFRTRTEGFPSAT